MKQNWNIMVEIFNVKVNVKSLVSNLKSDCIKDCLIIEPI